MKSPRGAIKLSHSASSVCRRDEMPLIQFSQLNPHFMVSGLCAWFGTNRGHKHLTVLFNLAATLLRLLHLIYMIVSLLVSLLHWYAIVVCYYCGLLLLWFAIIVVCYYCGLLLLWFDLCAFVGKCTSRMPAFFNGWCSVQPYSRPSVSCLRSAKRQH